MGPKIVFVVLSAVAKPGTVDQLVHALAPHQVLVHHDFTQTPDFRLSAPNATFVENPKRTGWGVFGFLEAMFHSLRYALERTDFDYLHLLSPTCLPIKPIAEFEAHVAQSEEAHFDCVDLLEDEEAFMNIAYRAFLPKRSMRHRIMRRVTDVYFWGSRLRRDEAGVWLRSGGGRGPAARVAGSLIGALRHRSIGRHFADEGLRPYYGSAWIGARRPLVEGLVDAFERPGIREHFSRVHIAEEFLMVSFLKALGAKHGPMNHEIHPYVEAHVGEFDESDFELLKASPKYFARKFPDDPASPLRLRVLKELVGVDPGALADVPEPAKHPDARAGASIDNPVPGGLFTKAMPFARLPLGSRRERR